MEGNDDDDGQTTYSAQTCVKSRYLASSPHYVVKVASQCTGTLEAIFLDDGLLTELRTAAAGAIAARLLMLNLPVAENERENDNCSCSCVGIVGRARRRVISCDTCDTSPNVAKRMCLG